LKLKILTRNPLFVYYLVFKDQVSSAAFFLAVPATDFASYTSKITSSRTFFQLFFGVASLPPAHLPPPRKEVGL